MTAPAYSSFTQWYCEGQQGSYVRTRKSQGGILDLLEVARPAGDMARDPELVRPHVLVADDVPRLAVGVNDRVQHLHVSALRIGGRVFLNHMP